MEKLEAIKINPVNIGQKLAVMKAVNQTWQAVGTTTVTRKTPLKILTPAGNFWNVTNKELAGYAESSFNTRKARYDRCLSDLPDHIAEAEYVVANRAAIAEQEQMQSKKIPAPLRHGTWCLGLFHLEQNCRGRQRLPAIQRCSRAAVPSGIGRAHNHP